MAKARMLHKSISVSMQVNSLPLQARLLFSWLIPHADDEGRLKGDPTYIKANVVPMTNWSPKNIKSWLEQMTDCGLIYYWQKNNEWFIEFAKWNDFQTIRKDRFVQSKLPSYKELNVNQTTTISQPSDNQQTPQYNISESNSREVNISESNGEQSVADDKTSQKYQLVNPKDFQPSTEGETAACEAWKKLEPNNPLALATTYLHAYKCGLPPHLFYVFTSEINQDSTIVNRGAVFNQKVKEYLAIKTETEKEDSA